MTWNWNPFKIFYGWWISGASFLIALFVGGAVFYGFTAFFEPIANEMGWSYTQISLAASLRGLEIGLLSPFVGILADRWGPKRLIFGGVLITAAGLLLLGVSRSLLVFYGAFALLAVGASACTVTVLLTAVANWFREKMGMASGIAIAGFGFSGLLIPVIVKLIATYDWRTAVTILALSMLVLLLPLSLLFRHRPEQYGYFPDGEKRDAAHPDESGPQQTAEVELRARQALKSGVFWRLALSRLYHMMTVAAIITHVMPYLSSIGISRAQSSLVATVIPLMSIFGRLGFGWLGDKLGRRQVATASFIMIGSGVLCFAYTSTSIWFLAPFLVLMGIGYGGSNALLPSLGREHFGRANFGSIYGLMEGIGTIGGIIGPAAAGWFYDTWGSYQIIWWLLAVLASVAITLVFTIRPAGASQPSPLS
ncbi:MAG TPA: MFS transporter [Dehalococcoidia bacterium]|jgi:MFS family permease|nr:MFS transporter [Dehalococcoidia bacterium]